MNTPKKAVWRYKMGLFNRNKLKTLEKNIKKAAELDQVIQKMDEPPAPPEQKEEPTKEKDVEAFIAPLSNRDLIEVIGKCFLKISCYKPKEETK